MIEVRFVLSVVAVVVVVLVIVVVEGWIVWMCLQVWQWTLWSSELFDDY